jgi:hypothetical protein
MVDDEKNHFELIHRPLYIETSEDFAPAKFIKKLQG